MPPTDFVVLALDANDAAEWRAEHPELADTARVVVANGHGWAALRGIVPSALSLGRRAAEHVSIGGTETPRSVRLALAVAERRREAVLA